MKFLKILTVHFFKKRTQTKKDSGIPSDSLEINNDFILSCSFTSCHSVTFSEIRQPLVII